VFAATESSRFGGGSAIHIAIGELVAYASPERRRRSISIPSPTSPDIWVWLNPFGCPYWAEMTIGDTICLWLDVKFSSNLTTISWHDSTNSQRSLERIGPNFSAGAPQQLLQPKNSQQLTEN
jgi:hypothetical protein